jgi:hypothetical protein
MVGSRESYFARAGLRAGQAALAEVDVFLGFVNPNEGRD